GSARSITPKLSNRAIRSPSSVRSSGWKWFTWIRITSICIQGRIKLCSKPQLGKRQVTRRTKGADSFSVIELSHSGAECRETAEKGVRPLGQLQHISHMQSMNIAQGQGV